jgi:hypothetical protein
VSSLPPVSVLFAAFLGYNPMQTLLGPSVLSGLTTAQQSTITGQAFFSHLISEPFHSGLTMAFIFAAVISLLAAGFSWSRGPQL